MFKCQKQVESAGSRNHTESIMPEHQVYLNCNDKIDLTINLLAFCIIGASCKEASENKTI